MGNRQRQARIKQKTRDKTIVCMCCVVCGVNEKNRAAK